MVDVVAGMEGLVVVDGVVGCWLIVDRGYGLDVVVVGCIYAWQTFFSKKKGLLTDIVNQKSQ